MRIFGLIFFLIVLVFGLSFAALNADTVQINYYFGARQAPLSLILVMALIVGALLGMTTSISIIMKCKRKVARLRKEIEITEKEVMNLRTIPIKEER